MDDYPTQKKPVVETVERRPEPKYDWITDICRNKDCRDGTMTALVNGYETCYNCPVCNVWDDVPPEFGKPKCAISGRSHTPSLARWKGVVRLYTDDELTDMIKDRRDVHLNARAARR